MTSTRDALYALEIALARRDRDAIPGGYEAALAEDFLELGSSGRLWTRDAMLEALEAAPVNDAISIEAFDVAEVGPGVFLVLYETTATDPRDGRILRSRRSSLWLRDGSRFRLRFHQGTPVPETAA